MFYGHVDVKKLSGHEFKLFDSMQMHSRHGKMLDWCEHCTKRVRKIR